jgi:hypothetical protein
MSFGWYIYRMKRFRLRPILRREPPYWAIVWFGFCFTNLNQRVIAALEKAGISTTS